MMKSKDNIYKILYWTIVNDFLVRYGGQGQAGGSQCQIDNAADIGHLLNNKDNQYWNMQNGYLLADQPGYIQRSTKNIQENSLEESIRAK